VIPQCLDVCAPLQFSIMAINAPHPALATPCP
jgi:hypothetical protein